MVKWVRCFDTFSCCRLIICHALRGRIVVCCRSHAVSILAIGISILLIGHYKRRKTCSLNFIIFCYFGSIIQIVNLIVVRSSKIFKSWSHIHVTCSSCDFTYQVLIRFWRHVDVWLIDLWEVWSCSFGDWGIRSVVLNCELFVPSIIFVELVARLAACRLVMEPGCFWSLGRSKLIVI